LGERGPGGFFFLEGGVKPPKRPLEGRDGPGGGVGGGA